MARWFVQLDHGWAPAWVNGTSSQKRGDAVAQEIAAHLDGQLSAVESTQFDPRSSRRRVHWNTPPPWKLLRTTDADTRIHAWISWWRSAVALHAHPAVVQDEIRTIETAIDAHCLRQFRGPVAQLSITARTTACSAHVLDIGNRLHRTQQHAPAFTFRAADGVAAPVHAVGEIHIHVPRRAKHRAIALGGAVERMRSGIFYAAISFDFDDSAGTPVIAQQDLVQQFGRDHPWIALEKGTRQALQRRDSGLGVEFDGRPLVSL